MKSVSYICVSGYFSSGSSAVVDLVKEFRNTHECGAEIRLIKDPHGITQLEDVLVNNWELINSAAALEEYYAFCKKCARSGGKNPFEPAGLGYSKRITPEFMQITKEYIDSLTKFEYKADYYYNKFQKNYFQYIVDRWRWAIEYLSKGKYKTANRKIKAVRFSAPTQDEFSVQTKKYFEKLFEHYVPENEKGYVILDQAISPNNPLVIYRYLNNSKLIIVSRDPRDMYIDNILWGVGLDNDLETAEAGYRFVTQQRMLRRNQVDDVNVFYVRFEDLVLNYDITVEKLLRFLNFSEVDHVKKKEYLVPEKSSKNVGIWKQYYRKYKDAIDVITKELSDWCVEAGDYNA
jgi:hypothetical protein